MLSNLADERDDDHPRLWLRFAEALGMEGGDVLAIEARPETGACVAAFSAAAQSSPLPFAFGMIYGYESQTPSVAATKIAGLRSHHGIEGEGLDYFKLHGKLDVKHAGELAEAISGLAEHPDDVAQAAEGAGRGAGAVWGLLDGVARARGLA